MKRTLLLILTALIASTTVKGESQSSRWTFYSSYHNFTSNLVADEGKVYSIASGALVIYDTETTQVSTVNKTSGVSDAGISLMAYSPTARALLLIYNNSNMDVCYVESETVANMPQYKNASLTDHSINDATLSGNYAYVATATGISIINLKKAEFSNTYNLSRNVNSAVLLGSRLYAFTDEGVYEGNTATNLLDPKNWTLRSATVYTKARIMGGRIYALSQEGLVSLGTDPASPTILAAGSFSWLSPSSESLIYGGTDGVAGMVDSNGTLSTLSGGSGILCLSKGKSSTYWASCGTEGLRPYRIENNALVPSGNAIRPEGPAYNYCDKMYVAPSSKLWVAGGSMNYLGLNYEATLYSFDGSRFVNYPDTLEKVTGLPNYRNVTGVAEDPLDASHIFATTAETGLYEFRNGKFAAHYDYEENGGHLYSAAPGYGSASRAFVRTSGPTFDSDGNLWMLNFEVDTIVQVRKKDGSWRGLYIPSVAKWPTFDRILLDGKGRAWITHRRTTSTHHAGVVCLNYGGTIDNASDDQSMIRYNFTNQDGETERPTLVYDLCMDKEGQIWVATNAGPYVIRDPDNFLSSNFTFNQIKVPRNDGTNYADYLLDGIPITSIAVDNAGRKWFATSGNGLYFISADNMTELAHFTTKNSPLISDDILSVAVMDNEGLVMIGTSEGLMSYRYDKAVNESDFTDKNIKVYPNPVRPDYSGNITISGLTEGAEVKISSTGGQVVASGKSTGGTFTWDGCAANGSPVAAGVYYILCSTSSGNKSAAARVVIVR